MILDILGFATILFQAFVLIIILGIFAIITIALFLLLADDIVIRIKKIIDKIKNKKKK